MLTNTVSYRSQLKTLLSEKTGNTSSPFFSIHSHSQFSTVDGMAKVPDMVERAHTYGWPGFALTDHGNMSGTIQMYKAAKKLGIKPFPGIETYIIDPKFDVSGLDDSGSAQRYHLGLLALDLKGYQGLVKLSTKAFERPRFNRFPRLLVDDLVSFGAEYGKNIAVTTGCYFGLLQRTLWEDGEDAADGILRQLKASFPNLYVELHAHDIPHGYNEMDESYIQKYLIDAADYFELPIVAAPDSHYLEQEHKKAHSLMKRMVYGGVEDDFPGSTYHIPSAGWMQEHFEPAIWSRIEDACADLLEKNTLSIPQLDTFQVHVPEMSKSADEDLSKKCIDVIDSMIFDSPELREQYESRLAHELYVIEVTKTANYFLLVLNIVDYVKSKRIPIEARGSAGGSLVCFLLGITQVDPIVWKTTFARFMSEDRIEPPDIDIDIADKYRYVVLDYLNSLEINGTRYKTSQIGTYGRLGQDDDDPNDTGSAFNQYVSSLKRKYMDDAWTKEKNRAERDGKKPVKKTADEQGMIAFNMSNAKNVKRLDDVKTYYPEDYEGLKEIINMNSVYKSRGTHAGGILISSEETSIEEFVPLMYIPKQKDGTWVTQYTMDDVKYLGLLKMDWLGQTSLTVMSKCLEFLGRDPLDFSWIPFDDKNVMDYVAIRKNHIGLFHLEQYPKSVAMSEMKPKSTNDFVIWQAYSMPGAVDSGAKDIYLKRRKAKKFNPDYTHEVLHSVFDDTLGVMLYQEQVLDTCRGIGMDGEELTSFFKIVKDSGSGAVERNRARLEEMKPRFSELATTTGLTLTEIDWVWHQIVAMGGYAFNKAHAAGYGIRSYRTAYLKFYYPKEYMAALLFCWAGSSTFHNKRNKIKKDAAYLTEAKRMNIRILPVRVNKSDANWKVEGNSLRKGYISVTGIGPSVAPRLGAGTPYKDVLDFCTRGKPSGAKDYLDSIRKGQPIKWTGILKTLDELDAFSLLGV